MAGTRLATLLVAICASDAAAKFLKKSQFRRLNDEVAPVTGDFMWGTCDEWSANVSGCSMADGLKCSSNLYAGPPDADIEFNITQLPPSTPGNDMHLQWWAPRKSAYPYYPMHSPQGCAIYWNIREAYPSHTDEDFNGGNVRISEEGVARIRVSSPSSYRVDRWILYPHIHLRLCSGDNFAHWNPDTIFFAFGGPRLVRGFHGQSHGAMLNGTWTPDGNVFNGVTTRTFTTSDATGQMPDGEGLGSDSGLLLNDTSNLEDLRIQDAKDALDLDALEFSPVYQCLLEGKFFSYRTSSCVAKCPADMDVVVGQCVKKPVSTETTAIQATWRLELACAESCFHDKLNVTLHHVRLSVGDLLEIPFSEVESASLTISKTLSSRRLAGSATHVAMLEVKVKSSRVTAADNTKLKGLIPEVNSASWLLGFEVFDVQPVTDGSSISDGTTTVLTDSTDPYAVAYNKAAPGSDKGSGLNTGSPLDFLPLEALIGIAVAILVLGAVLAVFLCRRRRRGQGGNIFTGQPPVVTGRPAGKDVGEDDYPVKPSNLGAACDDDGPTKPSQAASSGLGLPSNVA